MKKVTFIFLKQMFVVLFCLSCSSMTDEDTQYPYSGEGFTSLNPHEDILGKWMLIAEAPLKDENRYFEIKNHVHWEFHTDGTCRHFLYGNCTWTDNEGIVRNTDGCYVWGEPSYTIDGDILNYLNDDEIISNRIDGYKIRFFENGKILKLTAVTPTLPELRLCADGVWRHSTTVYTPNIYVFERIK